MAEETQATRTYSIAAVVAERAGDRRLHHREVPAESLDAARRTAAAELGGRDVVRGPIVREIPAGHTSVAATYRNGVGDVALVHGTSDRDAAGVRGSMERDRPAPVPRGYRVDQVSAIDPAQRDRAGALDIPSYAGRVLDTYQANREVMDAGAARQRTLSVVPAMVAAEKGLSGADAQRVEAAAAKVGQSVIAHYEARLADDFSPRRARAEAIIGAAGHYDGKGEPRQREGTMDVKAFAARTIEQYRFQAGFHGQAAAKSMVVYDAAANVEANGVNGTLAARVATAAVNEYDRLGAKGATHELARDAAARKTAERYDEKGQDRTKLERGRDRGGLGL